ncbi:MAG: Eco47II family restriction endonuclease [Fusobacteriaceae bacterium]
MNKYKLDFITDENIYNHVKSTMEKYRFKMDLKQFNKNIIDPIKLTFDAKVYKKTWKEIIQSEIIRQMDKSNTNHIGYFHQNIFKYIGEGWEVPTKGWDIINEDEKIYVEMKNKHNTMNSSSAQKTYMKMQNEVLNNHDSICYLVEIISKKSQNKIWITSLDNKSMSHVNIRRISIDKFYEMVTGDKVAFKKLCEVLPIVMNDVLLNIKDDIIQESVFDDLSCRGDNMIKTIYLLAFETYEGFYELNIN